jgi:hypothetical protein
LLKYRKDFCRCELYRDPPVFHILRFRCYLNAGLSEHAQRVVRLIANGLAKLDDDECYQVCAQLCEVLPKGRRG